MKEVMAVAEWLLLRLRANATLTGIDIDPGVLGAGKTQGIVYQFPDSLPVRGQSGARRLLTRVQVQVWYVAKNPSLWAVRQYPLAIDAQLDRAPEQTVSNGTITQSLKLRDVVSPFVDAQQVLWQQVGGIYEVRVQAA